MRRWQDIDLRAGIWTIPLTKQGKPLAVPLSRQSLALLREILPLDAAGNSPDPTTLVFVGARGRKLGNWDRATKRIHEASGTGDWHRHDVRRSVASVMGDLGVAPHVVEVCLGHALRSSADGSALSRVATTYNTSRYRREHADALQQLADELDRIEKGGAQIVRLARA